METAWAAYAPPHQQPGDKSLKEAAETWRVGLCKARRMLKDLVQAGAFAVIEDVQLNNGKIGRVWRPVKKGKK